MGDGTDALAGVAVGVEVAVGAGVEVEVAGGHAPSDPNRGLAAKKTSVKPLVSPGTRLVAAEAKAMKRPSALMEGPKKKELLLPFPWAPSAAKLTRSIIFVTRS